MINDVKGCRGVLAAILERAICDVYNWEIKGIQRHSREYCYQSALSYLNGVNSSVDLAFLGINMTGNDILLKIRSNKIVPVMKYGIE